MDRTATRTAGPRRSRRFAPPAAYAALLGALCALIASAKPALGAGGAAGERYLLTATHAGGAAAPRVFLRWAAVDRQTLPPTYERFLIKRKAPLDLGATDYATVEGLHDLAEITAVFPPGSEIQAEVESLFVPGYASDLSSALLALRVDTSPARVMQRQLLMDANYGVAIVEGSGFLDTDLVGGGRYLYELWGLGTGDAAVERLGKIWVLAGSDTILPKTELLEVVPVADTDNAPQGNFPDDEDVDLDGDGRLDTADWGDGKIHLRWKPPLGHAKERESQPTGFGFDIYRDLKGGGACPPAPGGAAVKVNRWPVLGGSAPQGDLPDFFFVDDSSNPAIAALVKGTEYCYWLVARNLLRQPGMPSDPAVGCVPDLGRPRQVRDVKTLISGGDFKVTWTPNASDPPTVVGMPYVDDTVGYNVYRFTDFSRVVDRPSPSDRVATALPATATAWTDSVPGGPADNPSTIFWYTVTAVDTAFCGRPANESPNSAPARGIIYDTTGPTIETVSPFCGNETCQNPQNPRCCRDCSQTLPPSHPNAGWCQAGGASGLWPLRGDLWGYRVPSGGTDSSDTMSVRLYRGSKGVDFRPVEESFRPQGTAGDWVLLETPFAPRVSQKLDYRLRALDFDSNLGPTRAPRTITSAGAMPAFLRGDPPLRPTVVRTTTEAGGGVRVRWNAPGAAALAGFLVRVGPEDDAEVGTFYDLPEVGLPAVPNFIHETTTDTDSDGISAYDIIIRDTTKCLADVPAKGGLEVTGGFFERVFTKGPGDIIEIYSVDITGQLSAPAIAPAPNDAPSFRPPWPARSVGSFTVEAQFVSAPPGDRIELCWTQTTPAGRCTVGGGGGTGSCSTDADCPAGSFCDESRDPAPYVAVFRALDEAGAVDHYQQRSPRLKIRAYLPGVLSHCHCAELGFANPETTACWQDWDTVPGVTYKYSVQRFWGSPEAGESRRSEGEIHSAGIPVEVAR